MSTRVPESRNARGQLMRFVVLLHRYLGIGFCLLFAMWFGTGMVMLFVPYPTLSAAERYNGLAALDLTRCKVGAAEAFLASGLSGPLGRVRLTMVLDRPVYHFHPLSGAVVSVFADSGSRMPEVSPQQATLAAQIFSRARNPSYVQTSDYDQWSVPDEFDPYRPLHKVALNDREGTELYVSQRTGEVIRDTTAFERGWNYVGSVAHWIYPTVLRKHRDLWAASVWWLAFAGIVGAASGTVLGVVRFRFMGSYRSGGRSPFRGWMYWHHVLGLGCAVFVLTWISSGWLSLDGGWLFSEPYLSRGEQERFMGGPLDLARFDRGVPDLASSSEQDGVVKEVELVQVTQIPLYAVRYAERRSLVVSADSRERHRWRYLPDDILAPAAAATLPKAAIVRTDLLQRYDSYYYANDGSLPLPAVRFYFNDANETWLHIDPAGAQAMEKIDRSRRTYRWLYSGLHTFDFPALAAFPMLRNTLMVTLCAAGLLFSTTAVVIGWRRLRRKSRVNPGLDVACRRNA
jgi:uncharacterized iron-regulated membrane protein